ncbi:MAG: acyl-CoA dehydrogenase family protein [Phycisphaerales bacterium JB043]
MTKKANLAEMKGVSAKDQEMIRDAEKMLGPEPEEMGFIKNLFWGNLREDLVFPYPESSPEETARADQLVAALDEYLRTEHPTIEIDQEQHIPEWCIQKLFDLGVLGMTIPSEYGGLGLGITSYNRVLERLGATCASTAVVVSAHQSIGCKAIMMYGTPAQKERWLPRLAKDTLSAFCLSEPNVGCDAGGQETDCVLSEDGSHYVLNGEKKWATSGALSGVFTVMANQMVTDPRTGKEVKKVTALICTPDMGGIDIFQKNRSKCGIRGTWQARLRFTDVRVPRENLLHEEGRGLNVALSCLNYGRCTLSAGMLGGAKTGMAQSIKWAQTRHQFQRPLAEFELVRSKIAHMAALNYAADAMLYMTTGMLDRQDTDIMVETAACKVFCSEMGWRVMNDAMQIMGGEGYMTENELERAFRDSRIYTIVEGANEVMQSFIFAYGGKQLAEQMLGVQGAVGWDKDQTMGGNLWRIVRNGLNGSVMRRALPLAWEVFFNVTPSAPDVTRLHGSLDAQARRFAGLIAEHTHNFKMASKLHEEKIVTRQVVQARIADSAIWLHAMACVLSRLDMQIRRGDDGIEFARDRAAALHFLDLADIEIRRAHAGLHDNADESMREAAQAALDFSDTLPNDRFYIHEKSPTHEGQGRDIQTDHIEQFPGEAATSRA